MSPMVNAKPGLSTSRAQELLKEVGPNAISEQRPSALKQLTMKFWAPVPWMLEATVLLEVVLSKWFEAGIIAAVLIFNAALAFVQEGRAQSALQLLRSRLEINARVHRDGGWHLLPACELVPGDLVHVRAGDFVPADLLLSEGEVRIDQSMLTGESATAHKRAGESIYSGSTVVGGEASGEVTATGPRSYFGRTAELVREAGVSGHLNQVVLRMVRAFIIMDLVLAIAGTVWLATGNASISEILSFAVVILLASVPVALPAAFALSGALAAQHLAKLGILTSRLTAVQDAATMDILCTDKTGTITQNRLSVSEITARAQSDRDEVLFLAVAASDEATQDPIDLAIISASQARILAPIRTRLSFVPFDPTTKRAEATFETDTGILRVTKGAPQIIATLCGDEVDPELERLAANGARVLAVAMAHGADPWHQVGLVALADPPRPDAAALIEHLTHLGVRVIMLTGDSLATGKAIAALVGINGPAVRAKDISDSQNALDFGVVAEVLPEDKYQIVRHLQTAGHVVGMTGDGVNDAPALRQAELGVAVAGASDIAKSAAGIVLTEPGLTDIADLVEESRREHQRSVTYALNVAVKKIQVPLLLTIGVFAWHQFVFTPLLMALMLLGNDVASMSIMTDRASFSHTPDTWDIRRFTYAAVLLAGPQLLISLGILWVARNVWPILTLDPLRTVIFLTLIISSQSSIYLVRTPGHFWSSHPGSGVILASLADSAAAVALVLSGSLMTALTIPVAGAVIGTVLIGTLLIDVFKVPAFRALGIHRR